ncbi:MAG: hypothetical protein NZ900_08350 [Synergistetes bacterium]|nr:hypothetical protein [Synergistota bacterium]MDW8192929.1 hypothetical protein [Synergistota bacterium]
MVKDINYSFEEGLRNTLLEVIEVWFVLKFGIEGKNLLDKLKSISDVEKLKKVKDIIMEARSLSELEKFIEDLI